MADGPQGDFKRLVNAVGFLRKLQKSPLFALLPVKSQATIGKLVAAMTNEALTALRPDPAAVAVRVTALEPRVTAFKAAVVSATNRLRAAGWNLADPNEQAVLRRATRPALLAIYTDSLGPDQVSISPSGELHRVGTAAPPTPSTPAPSTPAAPDKIVPAANEGTALAFLRGVSHALKQEKLDDTAGRADEIIERLGDDYYDTEEELRTTVTREITEAVTEEVEQRLEEAAEWDEAAKDPELPGDQRREALNDAGVLIAEAHRIRPIGRGFYENALVVFRAVAGRHRLAEAPLTMAALAAANAALADARCTGEERDHARAMLGAAESRLRAALLAGDFAPTGGDNDYAKYGPDADDYGPPRNVAEELQDADPHLRIAVTNAISIAESCGAGQTGLFTKRVKEEITRTRARLPADLPERINDTAGGLTSLAESVNLGAVVRLQALAHYANVQGGPSVAQGLLKLATPQSFVMDPAYKATAAASAALVKAAKGDGLGAPEQRKLAQDFATALPATTIKAATDLRRTVEQIAADCGAAVDLEAPKVPLRVALHAYVARNDQTARLNVRKAVDLLAAQLLTAVRVSGLPAPYLALPTDLTDTDVADLPEGVVDLPPSTTAIQAESERIEREDVPPQPAPQPTDPGTSPAPDAPEPTVSAVVPTLSDLKTYIAAAEGNAAEAKRMIKSAFSGWWNSNEFHAAVQSYIRDLVSAPSTVFSIYRTQAPASADFDDGVLTNRTHDLSGAPDANQPPGAAQWRRVAVPANRVMDQVTAYTRAGGATLSEDQYLMQHGGAAGRPPEPLADEGRPPSGEPAEGLYFIEDADGGYDVSIDSEAYGVLMYGGGTLLLSAGRDEDTVTNDFGTVYLQHDIDADRYRVSADRTFDPIPTLPPQVTGFLAELERQRIADCATSVCVSTIIGVEAQGGVTLRMIEQGLIANLDAWADDLGVALQTVFTNVGVGISDTEATARFVEDGSAAGDATVTGSVNHTEAGTVAYRFIYASEITGLSMEITGVLPLADFIGGGAVSEAVMDKAEYEGWFSTPQLTVEEIEEVEEAVIDLDEDWFQGMLADMVKSTEDELRKTISDGTVLGAEAPAKKKRKAAKTAPEVHA